MDENATLIETKDALDLCLDAFDHIDHDQRRFTGDAERLDLIRLALELSGRAQALVNRLAAEAERRGSAVLLHGHGVASWMAQELRLTGSHAHRIVKHGDDQLRFGHVGQAVLDGTIWPEQAVAITTNLKHLPDECSPTEMEAAETHLIGEAAQFDAGGLRQLSAHMLEVIAPDKVDELEGTRLEAEEKQARRDQHLDFHRDGASMRFSGSLPLVDGMEFEKLINAEAERIRRHDLDAGAGRRPEASTRRAQALVNLVARWQHGQIAPVQGGDRPRAVVGFDYNDLMDKAVAAHLVDTGDPVPAGVLRRMLCDAEILPVVFAGGSVVLDVGRSARTVPVEIRRALERRDQGCVFPGCEIGPGWCEAHHIKPWWAGGETSFENLTLLCRMHHGIIEPGHDPTADRWQLYIAEDGIPEVIPPRRSPLGRTPRRHQRFRQPTPV
jgi:hypothetical protein